jgi:hypothetical protein
VNAFLNAQIDRLVAELPAVTPPVEGELGWGRELSCVEDCTDSFAEIGPYDPAIIMQAIARRYQTPRGTLLDDPEYGLDLRGYLHKGLTQKDLRQLQTQALGEANKDQRIDRSATQLTLSFIASIMRVSLRVTPRDPRGNPFPFVVRISGLSAVVEA